MVKLLSIIITTKNRKDTLFYSVKTALDIAWSEKEMEIIIQDCSDNEDSEKLIKDSYKDDRIKYFRSPSGISMTENWNFAFENVKGKYVCIIGDDDGVLPVIKDVVSWADKNGIEMISSINYPRYYWPNFPTKKAGRLYITKTTSGIINKFDAEENLLRSSYGTSGKDAFLPNIYQGLVTKRILDLIKKQSGAYTATYIPDFYLMYSSLNYTKDFYKIGFALTVVGASKNSNTGFFVADSTIKEHTEAYKHYMWPDIFPDIKMFATILTETQYVAYQHLKRFDLIDNMDFVKLYAIISIWFPKMFMRNLKKVQKIFRLKKINPFYGNIRYFFLLLKRFLYGFISKRNEGTNYFTLIKQRCTSDTLYSENIYDACVKFQNEMNFKGYHKFLKEIE